MYKGRCYDLKPVPVEDNQYIVYVAYSMDLFEDRSVTNLLTSSVGNVFGFKVLRSFCLQNLPIPPSYTKTLLDLPT